MELLVGITALLSAEPGVYKLIIVDSIMALFRVDYSGRGELAVCEPHSPKAFTPNEQLNSRARSNSHSNRAQDRQQHLAQMLSRLQRLSEEFNLSIYMTNQMTSDPGATMTFVADPKKA